MLPEIVFFSESEDSFFRNADIFIPDIKRFIVIQIDRRIEPVRVETHSLSQKLPAPCNRFFLKVITKGEIAEHLKECSMAVRQTDIVNISGPDTLLAGGHAFTWRCLQPCKIRL